MAARPYIAVVGGVNMDITGFSGTELVLGDSNPGQVTMTPGGVGRNIAGNIARLGFPVTLVTALGDDTHAQEIRRHCASCGIDLSYSGVIFGVPTSTYLCINDSKGDCLCAIADMAVCDAITPEYLQNRIRALTQSQMIIVDANLSEETLAFIAQSQSAPIIADPVSSKKAPRLAGILGSLYAIKPNRAEAEILSGMKISSQEDLQRVGEWFLYEGVRHVWITLGRDGVFYMNEEEHGIVPCVPGPVVSTNGCGDAFLAAASIALLEGKKLSEAARLGQAASAVCARSPRAVNADLRMDSLNFEFL